LESIIKQCGSYELNKKRYTTGVHLVWIVLRVVTHVQNIWTIDFDRQHVQQIFEMISANRMVT